MTVGPEETGQDTGTGTEVPVAAVDNQQQGGDSLNPAWNELLEVVPSQLHSMVTPHLTKWDQNFQSKVNEVHSQYEPYKTYLDNQIEPESINSALQLMDAIEQRPMEVINALQAYAKDRGLIQDEPVKPTIDQQGQVDTSEIPAELFQHPEFVKLQQTVQAMAQLFVQQNQVKQETEESQALETELKQLHDTHGEFDEDWVLTKAFQALQAGQDIPLDKIVKQYKEFETGIATKLRTPGPKVIGAGGIAPDNQVDMKNLDEKGRRAIVMQMLEGAHQNNQ